MRQRQPVTPARAVWTRRVFPILLIVAAGAATYWNSLGGPFIWDDQISVVTNRTIQHLWPLSDPLRPPRETPVAGRPIVNLSFAINYAIGGLSEAGYHVGNIAVHIACALLLFGIVRRTLAGLARAIGGQHRARRGAPVDAPSASKRGGGLRHAAKRVADGAVLPADALLRDPRAAEPWHVASSVGRTAPPKGNPASRVRWQTLSVVACACGMASKESMAVAPLIVVLYDRAFEFPSIREAIRARAYLYAGLAATWIELGAFLWQQPRSTAGLFTAVDPWTYLLNQSQMLVVYLRLSVWPDPLILDYGLPRALAIRDVVPEALIVVLLIIASGVALARWPRIGFLAAAFFLTLAPTSSVIPIASEVAAERRMYLPFAALAVLAAVAGRWLVDRVAARMRRESAHRARHATPARWRPA